MGDNIFAEEAVNIDKLSIESHINRLIVQQLSDLGEGLHWCGWFGGWISVERNDDSWEVMWCSGKNTHNPLCGSSISVEFFDDRIGLVCKSAISMWPIHDEIERQQWTDWMEKKVAAAWKRR